MQTAQGLLPFPCHQQHLCPSHFALPPSHEINCPAISMDNITLPHDPPTGSTDPARSLHIKKHIENASKGLFWEKVIPQV